MPFASLHFLVFLLLVATASWGLGNRTEWRKNLLLAASAYFYACWDWRFLGLLWALACVCYVAGVRLAAAHSQTTRRLWLALSLTVCLATLALFKYHVNRPGF